VGHSRVRLKSLFVSLDLNEAWRREVGSSRECLKVFVMCVERPLELARCFAAAAFYSPLRESSRWSVRNPDMFRSGARHVRPTSLEPDLGTGYVRSWT
jgi:hypothetical protein